MGIPAHEKVIFDIERTPISKKRTYTKKHFYDELAPESNRDLSRFAILPHLKLTHGESSVAGQIVDHHDRFVRRRNLAIVGICSR